MKLQPGRKAKGNIFTRATRFVWTRLPYHQVIVNVPWSRDGTHQHVMIILVRGTNQSTTIDLTSLTLPELIAFRETVLIATEVAEPIVMALDDKALKGQEDGDDADDRVYRGLPTVIIRKGTLGEYDQGILQRRANVLSGIGAQLLQGGLPDRTRFDVDQQNQEERSAEDDAEAHGESA